MGNLCSKNSIEPPRENTIDIPQELQPYRITTADFKVETTLGKGAFGKVFLVSRKDTGMRYAMKVIHKSRLKDKKRRVHTMTERVILEQIKSDFIVKLHFAFQTPYKLFMVLDFMQGGELYFHMHRMKRLPVNATRFYVAEVILALEDLHTHDVIYRDLKPENILMDQSGHIKLADFNLAKHMNDNGKTQTICGSPEYIAPEIIRAQPQTVQIDYWGLGVLAFEMSHGVSPFLATTHNQLFSNILSGKFNIKHEISDDLRSFINTLLRVNPAERPRSSQEIKQHPFFLSIDWDLLRNKMAEAPIKPKINGPNDVSCFRKVKDTSSPDNRLEEPDLFQNFTYVGSNKTKNLLK